jgi:predicted ATPase
MYKLTYKLKLHRYKEDIMKVSSITLENFKRFTNLTIKDIPQSTKLVLIVGPNGSGKSSLFDAFNQYYRTYSGLGFNTDEKYYRKSEQNYFDWSQSVKICFHDHTQGQPLSKNSMYFRTAYRNDPDFNISSFGRIGAPHEQLRVNRLIDNDQTVSQNYQRLIHNTMSGVFSEQNDNKSVKDLREELIGKVRASMQRVFDDLELNNIGDPLGDGSFHFKKGSVESFHYKNLSGGEKAAFDLLLDLSLKIEYYDNSIFFIDEPETHMHTTLQGRLIEEMYRVLPDNCQMWMTTHSLGIMQKAKELLVERPGTIVFLDFGEIDFDNETSIYPASIDGIMWEKFLSVALGDYADVLAPERIVMCEGDINGTKRKNFDSYLYSTVFSKKYPQIVFVSGGSCNDLENPNHVGFKLLSEVLNGTKIVRLIDRDDKSAEEEEELRKNNIFVTSRRHIESYLLDDELIIKLIESLGKSELIEEALKIKKLSIESSISRGHAPDDIKSASGDIYVELKKLLQLTRCGNNADMFMRDTMIKFLTEDTKVYKEIEEKIIIPILSA